jgi:hypothetical protein
VAPPAGKKRWSGRGGAAGKGGGAAGGGGAEKGSHGGLAGRGELEGNAVTWQRQKAMRCSDILSKPRALFPIDPPKCKREGPFWRSESVIFYKPLFFPLSFFEYLFKI